MNILLIDKRVSRYEDIVAAIDPALAVGIVFDYFEDTFETLKVRIRDLDVSNTNATPNSSIGLVQHNYRAPMFSMLAAEQKAASSSCIVSRVEVLDPELATWTQFKDFIKWCKSEHGATHFDMMACALYSNSNWKYVIDALTTQTGVEIRASTDNTGSATLGGNWFLESHTGINLKGVYFTALIDEYKGLLFLEPYNRNYPTKSFAIGNAIFWPGDITIADVVAIYFTEIAVAALKSNGSVLNTYGNVVVSSGVIAVYSTTETFAALKSDGSAISWYDPGDGSSVSVMSISNSSVVSIYATQLAFAALKTDGSIIVWGNVDYGGTDPGIISGAVAVYSTYSAFAALKSDGSVVAWGLSDSGGTAPTTVTAANSGVVSIYSTDSAFAALKTDGSVVAWGASDFGGTAPTSVTNENSGVVAVYSNNGAFAALKSDGSVVAWGDSTYGGYDPGITSGVVSIYSNNFAFAALKTDGSVVAWGSSVVGGTAPSTVTAANSGVVSIYSTGLAFSALKSNGSLVVWGHDQYGGTTGSASSDLTSGVVAVYSVYDTFAALKSDGSIVAWNDFGSYASEAPSTVTNANSGVVAVYSNSSTFAAIKTTAVTFDLSASYYTGMDRYNILRKKENRRRVNLTTLNNNVFILSNASDIKLFNPAIPAGKTFGIIVPDYTASSSYSITSTATIPSGAGNFIVACDDSEPVTISGATYVNYGSYVYKRETNNTYTKLTTATIGGTVFTLYGGDGVNSSGIALVNSASSLQIPTIGAFTVPAPKSYGDAPFALTIPTSNSKGAFSFASDTPAVATITADLTVNALNFDGTNDFVDLGSNITEMGKASFTIECWIKTSATSVSIVNCQNGNTTWESGEKTFYIDSAGILAFVGFGNNWIYSTQSVNDGAWHHVAVVWEYSGSGTNGTGYAYVDGQDKTNTAYASPYMAAYNNSGTFVVGKPNNSDTTSYFNGSMAELRIWNTARSGSQIYQNFRRILNGDESGLVAYLQLNQGTASGANTGITTAANNMLAGGYAGTLTNFTLTTGATSNWVSGITLRPVDDVTIVAVGSSIITATQASTSAYSEASATAMLTVALGATSLTAFSVAASKTYGDTPFSIAPPTIGRAGAIVYGSNAPGVATINSSSGLITLVSAGTVTFTASQAETSQYSTGTVTSNVLTVALGTPTLSALLVPALKAYGDASFSITAPAPTSKSSGAITYSSDTTSVATIDESTGVITVVFPGTVTFTASQAAVPGEYVAAAAVTSGVLTVTLSEQTVAPGTSFADSDLSGVSLAGATLIGVSFSGATLTGADFSGATVTGANFTNANIVGATNLPAFSTTQKLQLLRNTDNVGIGAVQISTPLSGAEINAAITVPIPNIAGATFIVKAPAYNSSNEKVVTVSAGDITDHTSIYIPLNSGETVAVNGAAYTFDGTNVLDSNSSIVTTLSVLGVPFRIYVGSIILLNITLMTPTISAFTVASSKTLGDAAFAITMRPTSNSSGAITYTSNRPGVATIDASGNHIILLSAGAVTFTASQAEVPEAYAAITVTSNIMSVRNAQTRAPAPMNRWFSTNNAPRASASAASDRISALRARALYRDTMNAAAQGGYKVVGGDTGPRTVVYSGPVRVDGKCLGEGISGTTGGDVPSECVAYYIRSAASYRDLLDVTRGIYAGHSETHPDAASALKVPATPPANSDWVKLITPQGDPTVAVANRLTLNATSTSDALLLLSPPPQPQPQNNNNNNNNAAYDAALSAAPDPLKCIQYPPNPQLSITYGGAGCFI
jgi:hypothetical protein